MIQYGDMAQGRDGLTTKQKIFVKKYVENNGNGSKTALQVYDVKDSAVARSLASETLAKPNVKQELDRILQTKELGLNRFTDKLSDIVGSEPEKGYSGSDIMEAVKTGLKLHGVLAERKVSTNLNMSADFDSLSKYDLIQLHKKKLAETEAILQDEEE